MKERLFYICVTPFFPSPDNWRGAYILDQVKAIRRNSDFEVIVFVGGKDNCDYQIEGLTVFRFMTRGLPSNFLNGIFNRYNSRSFVNRVLALGINPNKVAYVHCHVAMHAACGLALREKNTNIKVLLQHHDLDPYNLRCGVIGRNNRFNIRYRAKKAIKLYNQVDLHVCISEACLDSLQQFPYPRKGEIYEDHIRALDLCKGLPSANLKNTYILYNGVDTTLFSPKVHNTITLLNSFVFRIGCISNFQELKDHITLIKAVEILIRKDYTNIRLSLLGTGATRQICEQYISEHGLGEYIEWANEVTHDKLPDYYRSLDLFVLPSYFEGFGCVYTEAAACGVPFMGCKNQGYSEYISKEDANKWLIEPRAYKTLANLIENQMCNPLEQKYCHTYNIDVLIRHFLQFIKTL